MKKLSMAELGRMSVPEFRGTEKVSVTLVLDNIRSLHNVGSAFRTADAFRLERIILAGITGTPPHREIEKTALGATQSVAWEYAEHPEAAVAKLRGEGYLIAAVEQTDDSTPLDVFTMPADGKLCLVFGNEVNGVSDAVIALADAAIEIPQWGTKHSLNVSVCIGIVAWTVTRHFHRPPAAGTD
ncbi:MAG: RNA methyltransferase [Bacteroidota bacterium]